MLVTKLRLVNELERWGLPFDQVDLAGKIDQRRLELKSEGYCAALSRAVGNRVPTQTLMSAATTTVDDGLGPRGKDVVAAGAALRRVAGSLPLQATSEPLITGQLHSSSGMALASSEWLNELRSRIGLDG